MVVRGVQSLQIRLCKNNYSNSKVYNFIVFLIYFILIFKQRNYKRPNIIVNFVELIIR